MQACGHMKKKKSLLKQNRQVNRMPIVWMGSLMKTLRKNKMKRRENAHINLTYSLLMCSGTQNKHTSVIRF